jgi:hypothetical protein
VGGGGGRRRGGLDLESDGGEALKQQIRNGHPHLGKMTPESINQSVSQPATASAGGGGGTIPLLVGPRSDHGAAGADCGASCTCRRLT